MSPHIDTKIITRYNACMAKPLMQYRKERFLTVREFADLLGVTPQTLYRIAAGKARPHPTTMRKIAQKLKVSPAEIAEFQST